MRSAAVVDRTSSVCISEKQSLDLPRNLLGVDRPTRVLVVCPALTRRRRWCVSQLAAGKATNRQKHTGGHAKGNAGHFSGVSAETAISRLADPISPDFSATARHCKSNEHSFSEICGEMEALNSCPPHLWSRCWGSSGPPLDLSYARSAADGVPDIDLILAKMPHSQKKCYGLPDPSVLTICVEI